MTESEKSNLRHDRGELERALTAAGCEHKTGTTWRCGFHNDQNPSAGVYQDKAGVWRFNCHSCRVNEDVIGIKAKAAGKQSWEVLKELTPQSDKPRDNDLPAQRFASIDEIRSRFHDIEAIHVYTCPDTLSPEMIIIRRRGSDGKKKFLQCRPDGDGFVMKAPPKPWPIYNRIRVASAERVLVVEGEKCVEALAKLGIVATTSPGGALKANYADWSPLAGKRVILWPDHDAPDAAGTRKGHAHMRQVQGILEQLNPPAVLSWLDPDILGMPAAGDAVDYIALTGDGSKEGNARAVGCAIELAEPISQTKDLSDLIENTISGKRFAIPWPWTILEKITQALLPGSVTAICGDPGNGKSFLLLQAAFFWSENGYKPAVYMLEEDRAYHLSRLLAQLDGNSNLTEADWIRANPAAAREALAFHEKKIGDFSRCIFAAPDSPLRLPDLLTWARERAQAGCQVIAIDPITAAATGDRRFVEDLEFMTHLKVVARQTGARMILMTHPKQNAKGWADMAGGSAFTRFAQNVFWIHKYTDGKQVQIATPCGPLSININRGIKIGKARNGSGSGQTIGFIFDGATLKFAEQGVISKAKIHEDTEA